MDIDFIKARRSQSEQAFSDTQDRRNEVLKEANELLAEMNRLEGEHRLLTELIQDAIPGPDSFDPSSTIEVTPERAKKGK
jgi:hypothetical protein